MLLFQGIEHFRGVAWNFDAAPALDDFPVRADEEGRTFHAHISPTVHLLLRPDAESFDDSFLLVRKKGYVKGMLGAEFRVGLCAVGRDADYFRAELFEFGLERGKIERLFRAS